MDISLESSEDLLIFHHGEPVPDIHVRHVDLVHIIPILRALGCNSILHWNGGGDDDGYDEVGDEYGDGNGDGDGDGDGYDPDGAYDDDGQQVEDDGRDGQ